MLNRVLSYIPANFWGLAAALVGGYVLGRLYTNDKISDKIYWK